MSVEVMAMVFKHYPGEGGEYTLALCLADFANPDGTSIFPSVERMAHNSRQSARTVQRQLRFMEESGWLICVKKSIGGKGNSTRYRINPEWIADPAKWKPHHDKLTPLDGGKPRHSCVTVTPPQTVTLATPNHDTAVSPDPPVTTIKPVRPTFANPGSAEPSAEVVDSPDRKLAEWMFGLVQALHPNHKPPNWKRWTREVRLLRERDGRTPQQIVVLFRWANEHNFWAANILSPGKLRQKWDQLVIQRKSTERGQSPPATVDQRCARCNDGTVGRRHVPGVGWLCNRHIDEHEGAHV